MDGGDAEIQRRALKEVFGESSSDSEGQTDPPSLIHSTNLITSQEQGEGDRSWELVEGINGLWLCREFLSVKQQSSLLQAIQREGWFSGSAHNQKEFWIPTMSRATEAGLKVRFLPYAVLDMAMRFGDLPEWATELTRCIMEAVCFAEVSFKPGKELTIEDQSRKETCPLPLDLLWREPLFDQLIVNVYKPGEGICAHVDLMRFDDGIAIVSLESACVMHFTRSIQEQDITEGHGREECSLVRIPVFLSPGSLIVMSGEARYLWKHEINRKPGFQLWQGKEVHQERRISVTLRKLRQLPNQCSV